MVSLSKCGMAHPPCSNPSLRSSSGPPSPCITPSTEDRKSTRLNSSHTVTSYAVFCLKKKIAETGKTIPYALFIPTTYKAAKKSPLIVALHGLGRPFDWMMGYQGMIDFAERDGFIVVSPLGYHPRGWYGSR